MNSSVRIGESSSSHQQWPHRIDAIAFDMDGLLINTELLYSEVLEELMQRRGRSYRPELRRAMMRLPGPQALTVMIEQESLPDRWEDLLEECDAIFGALLPKKLALMPGVLELIDLIDHHSLPRCVATSSRRVFAEKALSMVGILDRVGSIITAEDVERGKPFPDIYLAAAKHMGVNPPQMMALEDSGHGCRAALTSGACTVAVPGEHSRDQNFDGVAMMIDSLEDRRLVQWLVRTR